MRRFDRSDWSSRSAWCRTCRRKRCRCCRRSMTCSMRRPTMLSPATTAAKSASVRALKAGALDAVVAIDAALGGRPRRAYFERRLAAAQRDAERHLQLGIEDNGRLAGYMLGRGLEGEFGRSEPELRLEAFGIAPAAPGRGLGTALAAAFEAAAARRGLREIRTTALWREHALVGF